MRRLVFSAEAQVKKLNDSSGVFSVKSERNDIEYKVSLVSPNDSSVPSCECMDWRRNYLPCKHVLSVIESTHNSLGWEDLPLEYRESPYLTLDVNILFKTIDVERPDELIKELQVPDDSSCPMPSVVNSIPATTGTSTEIPKKAFPKRTHVTRCCDLLARIKNTVHECMNAQALKKLEYGLKSLLNDLEKECDSASGIILTSESKPTGSHTRGTKRKEKDGTTSRGTNKKLKLDIAKKRHLYNNRVGQKAQMMKKYFRTNMKPEEMMSEPSTVPCSVSESDDFDGQNVDIKPRTSYVNFTPVIKTTSNLRKPLLKNGEHHISLLELKSLESFLPRGTEIMLLSYCKEIRAGWLFDEIINSYFWCLQEIYSNVLYAPSTSMLVLQKGSPCGRLWSDVDISTKKYIIAAWNPTNVHWTLVAVNLEQKKSFTLTLANLWMKAAHTQRCLPHCNRFYLKSWNIRIGS